MVKPQHGWISWARWMTGARVPAAAPLSDQSCRPPQAEEAARVQAMSAEVLSTPTRPPGGLAAWLQEVEGRVRYQPWYIHLSTLDRRLLLALALLPLLLVVLLVLAVGLSVGSACAGGRYRGTAGSTATGLACVPWGRLNRSVHTVTPDRWLLKQFCSFVSPSAQVS